MVIEANEDEEETPANRLRLRSFKRGFDQAANDAVHIIDQEQQEHLSNVIESKESLPKVQAGC